MTKEYDLVVLGGGTGGYVAAIRAAQLGMTVALVEADKLGGTCLHRGCIPTKTLLRTAELHRQAHLADQYGINVTVNDINLNKFHAKKMSIINQLHGGIQALMQKNNIDIYEGYGRILGPSIFSPLPGTISVEYESGEENTMLVPKNVLIATGSRPKSLPGLESDGTTIMNSDDALAMESLPESIVIVGGGVIGVEWASLLTDLGVEVTIVEYASDILVNEDEDIRREVNRQLRKRGVKIYTDSSIDADSIETTKDQVHATINTVDGSLQLDAEKLLISVGRKANTEDIGLQNTNIETDNGFIQTNEYYATKDNHIYAIGDCIGGLQLAHVASEEGIVAVEHMAGEAIVPLKDEQIPVNIYSYPEVAKIGLTEREAKEKYNQIKVGRFPFQAIGKAHVYGDIDGFVKIISDEKTDDLLGIHIVGPQATELIGEASIAKFLDASAWEIGKTVHAHPSLAEVFKEAALATERMQIHG